MRGGRSNGGRGRGGKSRDRSPHHHQDTRRSVRAPRRSLSRPDHRRRSPSSLLGRAPRRSPGSLLGRAPRRSPSSLLDRAPRRSTSRGLDDCQRDHEFAHRGKQIHHEHEDGLANFHHEYMLPDHPTNLTSNANLSLQMNRSAKDQDLKAPSGDADGQGLSLQKPMFLGDGLSRTYHLLPQENQGHPADPHALSHSGSTRSNLGIGPHHSHELSRNRYDDFGREKGYNLKDSLFSEMLPSVQPTRPLVGGSTSSLPKDGSYLGIYGSRDDISKYADDPLKYDGYSQVQLSESHRRVQMSPRSKEAPLNRGYDELGLRGRDDPLFVGLEGTYREVSWGPRGEYRDVLGSSFSELAEDRVDRAEASWKNASERSFYDLPRMQRGELAMELHDLKGPCEEYSGSGYVGQRMRSSRDHEVASFEEGYSFIRDVAPMAYRQRERSISPLFVDHHGDMLGHGMSPRRGNSRLDRRANSPLLVDRHMDMLRHGDLGMYNLSSEGMVRRKYVTSDDVDGIDSRGMLSNDRNLHSRIRIQSPTLGDEIWSTKEGRQVLRSTTRKAPYVRDRMPSGLPSTTRKAPYARDRMPSNGISRNDQGISGGSYARAEDGRVMTSKKRLRPGPSKSRVSLASQSRHVLPRPYKLRKRGADDRHRDLNALHGDVQVEGANSKKTDPPESSEEFRKQVHKAFLRFLKLLNEGPHEKKRYLDDQGRSSNLLCRVCGSASKEFVDTHSLLTHSYRSLKLGLRTEHLGFHKALCVLMGWNWIVPPDTSKAYMSRCDAEFKALKEDLILWPPIVVINNSTIGNRNSVKTPKVISTEGMEEILKGMGFEVGKGRVCRGKPSNESVLLYKFPATFSGLQEAERLHKYYADKKRGREEFQKITSSNGEADSGKDEELLYGYMGIVEDLDKLDPETKKRCHVKSRKDIEAIADAPLNAD